MTPLRPKSMVWVIATFAVALLPQLPRMPAVLAALTLFPLAWRIGAELRGHEFHYSRASSGGDLAGAVAAVTRGTGVGERRQIDSPVGCADGCGASRVVRTYG